MNTLFTGWEWGPMSIHNVVSVKVKKTPATIQGKGNIHSYQLGIKFTGHSRLCYRGCQIDFRPGTIVYLPKEQTEKVDYTTVTEEVGNGVCIFFDSVLPLPAEVQMLDGATPEIEAAFLKVLHVWTHASDEGYASLMASFYALLSEIGKMNGRAMPKNNENKFRAALTYMQDHLTDSYADIEAMADACAMSKKYFRDSFKQVFGISPLQYFHKEKIKHACTLISDLSLSISEVAAACGFFDSNYFSRFFKKHVGISPTEYRNNYCKLL